MIKGTSKMVSRCDIAGATILLCLHHSDDPLVFYSIYIRILENVLIKADPA